MRPGMMRGGCTVGEHGDVDDDGTGTLRCTACGRAISLDVAGLSDRSTLDDLQRVMVRLGAYGLAVTRKNGVFVAQLQTVGGMSTTIGGATIADAIVKVLQAVSEGR